MINKRSEDIIKNMMIDDLNGVVCFIPSIVVGESMAIMSSNAVWVRYRTTPIVSISIDANTGVYSVHTEDVSNYIFNHRHKYDSLYISYDEPIRPVAGDHGMTLYDGCKHAVGGPLILDFVNAAAKYSGYDVADILRLRKDDHLYILGDVIDRGPEGLRILKDTMERGNVTLLLGNHEHMMLEALSHPDNDELLELWYANGGRVTHEHFKHCNLTYRAEVLSYIRNLPLNLEVSVNGTDYLLVHGAPASTYTKGSRYVNQTEYAVWTRLGRNTLLFEDKIVIFGHTPTYHYNHEYPMAIWHGRNKIGIDCGCARGADGRLGCLRLDDMQEFYSEEGV